MVLTFFTTLGILLLYLSISINYVAIVVATSMWLIERDRLLSAIFTVILGVCVPIAAILTLTEKQL